MTPASSPSKVAEGNAIRRLDQTMIAAIGASRVFALAQTMGVTRSIRHRVRHPRVLAVGVGALAAQSAWAMQRSWRRGTVRDRTIASSDAIAQCFALLIAAASWGARVIPSEARWSETYGAVVAAWLSFEDASPAMTGGSLLGWLTTYAVATGDAAKNDAHTMGPRINESAAHTTLAIVVRALGRQLVEQATELDATRAEAVAQAQRLAAVRERQHQHRIVHDSALQILEAIAGGWELDDELVQRRIDYEVARLQRLLGARSPGEAGLYDELATIVDQFALIGLRVDLEVSGLVGDERGASIRALAEATYEALTNVHKHAAASRTNVRVAGDDEEIRVSIVDDGRGFELGTRHDGFGLGESIRGRIRDVGGTTRITSSPTEGTMIELRVPR